MVGIVVWIGILVYIDLVGLCIYFVVQVIEQSLFGEGVLVFMFVFSGMLFVSYLDFVFFIFLFDVFKLFENQILLGELFEYGGLVEVVYDSLVLEVIWGFEDEEFWRKLFFCYWLMFFSYYNIILVKRYISLLFVILVIFCLNLREVLEGWYFQDGCSVWFLLGFIFVGYWEVGFKGLGGVQVYGDVILYKVVVLGLVVGIVLVLLLFCLYCVLCLCNYGQLGSGFGWWRCGELFCDDYGYVLFEMEIVLLVLCGYFMDIECLVSDGMLLVSCCLVGYVCVWDVQIGDCFMCILCLGQCWDSGVGSGFEVQESWE